MLLSVEQERVLIVISTSGNSPNVVVDDAHPHGLVTAGGVGFDRGAVRDRADECLSLESETGVHGPVESARATPCDILATCLMRDRPAMAEVP